MAGVKKWLVLIVVLVVGWMLASPFVTVYQMRDAAARHDGEALAEYIEFPSLRDDLKDQLNARIAREAGRQVDDDWLASIGGVLSGFVVDKVADALVTPTVVIQLMKGDVPRLQKPRHPDEDRPERKPFGRASYHYDSFRKFSVRVPETGGRELRFILRRRGIGWKLTAIRIPM